LTVKDYYRLLGVEREASAEEIKRAYRKWVMKYHPDRNQDKSSCEELLKEINEAYQVLGNEEKRRQYDLSCLRSFNRHVYDQEDLSDDLIEILRVFSRGGFSVRGMRGCKGRRFGKRGCGRWKGNFW